MALIIEDGTVVRGSPVGSADANSFVTVVEFQSFYVSRSDLVAGEAEAEEVEAALIKATDYMAQKFRLLWKGSRVDAFQPLDWPRRGVDVPDFFEPFERLPRNVPLSFRDTVFVPENEIPNEVKDCQVFLARETIDTSGVSSVAILQAALGRTTSREKVGSLEVQYQDAQGAADSGRLTELYYNASRRVEPFLAASGTHTGRVVRA